MNSPRAGLSVRLGGQAAFFLMGNIFTLLVGFPLQIYVARHLGSEGLGIFSMLEGAMGILAGLLALGLAPTLLRFTPDHLEQQRYDWIRQLVRKGLLMLVGLSAVACLLLFAAWPLVRQLWPALEPWRTVVLWTGLLVPLSLLSFFLQQGLRGFQDIRYVVIGASFLQLAVKALTTVVLFSFGLELLGYVWAVLLSLAVVVLWSALGLRRKLQALPQQTGGEPAPVAAWREYAAVMYSGSLLGMGAAYLDRFLLALVAGAHPVGILMIVKQLQQLPAVFMQMFLSIAAPMLAAAHSRGDTGELQHIYHVTTDWVVRLSLPLLLYFAVFAESLLHLYGSSFAADGMAPLRILLLAQAVNLGLGPVGQLMYMSGLEKAALRIATWHTLVNGIGLVVLVPLLGLSGAALAVLIGQAYIKLHEYFATRKAIGLRWYDPRFLRWLFPFWALLSLSYWVGELGLQGPVALIGWLLLFYVVAFALSWLQGLHDDDRQLLQAVYRRLGIGGEGEV
jgi:O-antigen/teichoic acid export membrane protein